MTYDFSTDSERREKVFMYEKMYTALFNAVTESLRYLNEGDTATTKWLLEEAQREAENIFMEWDWENEGKD